MTAARMGVAPRMGVVRVVVVVASTVAAILALAILPLLLPVVQHVGLDLASSARMASLTADDARAISDASVADLVFVGSGDFAVAGPDGTPFYDAAERAHLRDARILLWLALGAGVAGASALLVVGRRTALGERPAYWRAVSRTGAAVATVTLLAGIVALVAFEPLFTLFHEVAFPGGGWSFDASAHLVRLYPEAFWQAAAAALGCLCVALGTGAWWLGRSLAVRAAAALPAPSGSVTTARTAARP